MRQFKIGNRTITDESDPYIIAELGCNHNGDFQLCRQMIEMAAVRGVDGVKLQRRDNDFLFTKAQLAKPYNSENAFGCTIGEHRKFLELTDENPVITVSQEMRNRHGAGNSRKVSP